MQLTTPYSDAFPPLSTEEKEALRISIEQQGVRNACLATEDGRLLDGHARLEILPTAPVAMLPGTAGWSKEECLAFIYRCNRERRNLSFDQRREVKKKEREAAMALRGQNPNLYTQEVLARMFGVTQKTVSVWLEENITNIPEYNGYIPPDARIKVPVEHQEIIVARVEAGESQAEVAADYGITQPRVSGIIKRIKKEKESGKLPAFSGEGCTVSSLEDLVKAGKTFGTVYADPPWQYQNQGTRAATGNHYKTMTLKEIEALPVPQLAEKNAHLHLWTTNAFLEAALGLIKAWGFEFKSAFLWCKPKFGIGNYWRVSHEYLLLGVRGSCPFRVHNLRSWESIERGKHSAKPEEVRSMIERASPGHYLELFGRLAVKGWTVWGNQIARGLFTQSIPEGVWEPSSDSGKLPLLSHLETTEENQQEATT